MSDLPTLLRVQRAQRRWSQERAARELRTTFHRYRRFEAALVRPSEDEQGVIATTFALTERAVRLAVKGTTLIGEAATEA